MSLSNSRFLSIPSVPIYGTGEVVSTCMLHDQLLVLLKSGRLAAFRSTSLSAKISSPPALNLTDIIALCSSNSTQGHIPSRAISMNVHGVILSIEVVNGCVKTREILNVSAYMKSWGKVRQNQLDLRSKDDTIILVLNDEIVVANVSIGKTMILSAAPNDIVDRLVRSYPSQCAVWMPEDGVFVLMMSGCDTSLHSAGLDYSKGKPIDLNNNGNSDSKVDILAYPFRAHLTDHRSWITAISTGLSKGIGCSGDGDGKIIFWSTKCANHYTDSPQSPSKVMYLDVIATFQVSPYPITCLTAANDTACTFWAADSSGSVKKLFVDSANKVVSALLTLAFPLTDGASHIYEYTTKGHDDDDDDDDAFEDSCPHRCLRVFSQVSGSAWDTRISDSETTMRVLNGSVSGGKLDGTWISVGVVHERTALEGNGGVLVTGGGGGDGRAVNVWDLGTGSRLASIECVDKQITSVACAEVEAQVAEEDMYDPEQWLQRELHVFTGHKNGAMHHYVCPFMISTGNEDNLGSLPPDGSGLASTRKPSIRLDLTSTPSRRTAFGLRSASSYSQRLRTATALSTMSMYSSNLPTEGIMGMESSAPRLNSSAKYSPLPVSDLLPSQDGSRLVISHARCFVVVYGAFDKTVLMQLDFTEPLISISLRDTSVRAAGLGLALGEGSKGSTVDAAVKSGDACSKQAFEVVLQASHNCKIFDACEMKVTGSHRFVKKDEESAVEEGIVVASSLLDDVGFYIRQCDRGFRLYAFCFNQQIRDEVIYSTVQDTDEDMDEAPTHTWQSTVDSLVRDLRCYCIDSVTSTYLVLVCTMRSVIVIKVRRHVHHDEPNTAIEGDNLDAMMGAGVSVFEVMKTRSYGVPDMFQTAMDAGKHLHVMSTRIVNACILRTTDAVYASMSPWHMHVLMANGVTAQPHLHDFFT